MVGFVEAFCKALDSYKNYPLESMVFGIIYFLLGIIFAIPILGAFIGAYLVPRVLSWYYSKTIGNVNTDYKLSFRVWLFYLLLINLIAFQLISLYLLVNGIYTGTYITDSSISFFRGFLLLMLFTLPIVIVQSLVLQIFLTYTLYSVVLGKLSEFKVDVGKSLRVFGYAFGWGIIFAIVSYALGLIPIFGYYISIFFSVLFVVPIIQLVIANKVISI